MSKDGRDESLLLRFRHFHHPWWSAEELLLRFLHFHHPWWSYAVVAWMRVSSDMLGRQYTVAILFQFTLSYNPANLIKR